MGRRAAHQRAAFLSAGVRQLTAAMARAAEMARAEILRTAEINGREEARAAVTAAEEELRRRTAQIEGRRRALDGREAERAQLAALVAEKVAARDARRAQATAHEAEVARGRAEVALVAQASRAALERAAAETVQQALAAIRETEVEEARIVAARSERAAAEAAAEQAIKRAKRVMGIAVGRFYGHYLTERLHSILPVPPGEAGAALLGREETNLRAIESVAGVTLVVSEHRDSLRLEGLDGVGREVARRTLARLQRQPGTARDPAAVTRAAREVATALDAELVDLGRRAFSMLEIPAAHPEIVKLVGRLNYRTSYTQNQWKHAVEAAYLCGMMADELGLDLKLARRAALMHDIGKALTHELDGSHAVIGAEYARRLGEAEAVANAIGAHHTDEPFNSAYAYLVAAADAMSGGRPGARRQQDESYVSRIEDLERITRGFRGVAEAFAVQGGREVRVYVEEGRIDDRGAVNLSTEIAQKISQEMRFPGQIRVTVIRELKAVEVAS
ncbi:MAG TPA: HDIG domain-containing protein [Polyangia bacterium]